VAKTKTKTKEKTTLYTRIAEAAELEFSKEDYESPEDYKIELVEHFADIPEEDFDKLDEDIQTWINKQPRSGMPTTRRMRTSAKRCRSLTA
jgi:hypothetical protein